MKGKKAMTKETIMQIIRDLAKIAGGAGLLAGIGITGDMWTTIGGAAAIIVGVVWGLVVRKDANSK